MPTDEATVTLEDIQRILRIPIHSAHVVYDTNSGESSWGRVFLTKDLGIEELQDKTELFDGSL